MKNPRLLLTFPLCLVVLLLRSIESTEYLETISPKQQTWTETNADGEEVTFSTMFNFSADSYYGTWKCGWPLPWFHFDAKMFDEEEAGPYFALHGLASVRPHLPGIIVNSLVVGFFALLSAIGVNFLLLRLDAHATLRVLFVMISLTAIHAYLVQREIAEDALYADSPQSLVAETIFQRILNPLSSILVVVASVVIVHPKAARSIITRKGSESSDGPESPTGRFPDG